jgi:predicted secreted protein
LEAHKISLHTGETCRFELGGLGSAGYLWGYEISGDPGILSISLESYDIPPLPPPESLPPSSFSAGIASIITARESGITSIRFFLHRPWEHDKPPLKEVSLVIEVTDKPASN